MKNQSPCSVEDEAVGRNSVVFVKLRLWDYHRNDRSLKLPLHAHRFWQLNMIESGRALFQTADKWREVKLGSGELLFVPPGCEHLLKYYNEPCVGFSFKLELHGVELSDSQVVHVDKSEESHACINAIRELLTATFPQARIREGENIAGSDDSYLLLVESLLAGIFQRYLLGTSTGQSPLLRKLRRIVQSRHGQPVKVVELARLCGYSPGRLSELLRQECGLSAKLLIDRERAAIARQLLEFSEMNVGEISVHMGFKTPFAFSNFFHLHNGKSPRAFKVEIQRGIDNASGPAIQ